MKPLILFSFLAILFAGACKPSTGTSGPLTGSLDTSTARRLVHNFNGRVYRRNSFPGWHGSRTVWFSRDQLSDLINRIKDENGDGIRFYFAAYDSVEEHGFHCKPNYLDQSTLVMVSTFDTVVVRDGKKDTLHWDYYYNRIGRQGGIITATPENQGELCPPPANCYADGATLLP
ncbi:hypothetical protein Niako_1055 [Niastella koreensis GR20-10]|uniref:Lipoprotein n=2 Tax=Niastella koreensis TaxID=354356 RepID=G8THK6_NIAKG|nr:hypothetical protein [Niastella koreensis]AEV97434.1 hypothetical protein Niako_1055 [Niastella koreensis GR20-10]